MAVQNHYRVEVETEGREVYDVQAPDEEMARKLVADGEVGNPSISEVTGGSIEKVELVAEDVGGDLSDLGESKLGPFAKDSETSRKAALDAYPRQGTQRSRIIAVLAQRPLTREGLANRLDLSENTIRPRVKELIEGGWIEETMHTYKTTRGSDAKVLKISGRAAVELAS